MKLKIANEADRPTVAAILAKNGYTVKQSRDKDKNKVTYYIETVNLESEVQDGQS